MEALATESGKYFLGQGLLGALVVIVACLAAYFYLEKRNGHAKLQGELNDCFEARIQDGRAAALARAEDARMIIRERSEESRESAVTIERNTAALATINSSMEARTRAVEDLSRVVVALASQADNDSERVRDKLEQVLLEIRRIG